MPIHGIDKPSWKPEGAIQITFTRLTYSGCCGYIPQIWVMDGDGNNRFQPFNTDRNTPAWGRHLKVRLEDFPSGTAAPEFANGENPSSVSVGSGNVTLTFNSVQAAGDTTIDPVSPTAVLPLPAGYATIAGAGMAYQIKTAAVTGRRNTPGQRRHRRFHNAPCRNARHSSGTVMIKALASRWIRPATLMLLGLSAQPTFRPLVPFNP